MKKNKIFRIITGGAFALTVIVFFSGWLLKSKILPQKTDAEEGELEIEACGVERWAQKVLTDADTSKINFTPKDISIKGLITIATPSVSSNTPRQPQEWQLYKTHCILTKLKLEDDGDYHLVLADSLGNTIIGEIPDPTCSSTKPSHHIGQYKTSRDFIDKHYTVTTSFQNLKAKVVVTGMAYIDPPHGQTGAAPNNLELHSILDVYYDTAKPITTSILTSSQQKPTFNVYPNPAYDVINMNMEGVLNYNNVILSLYNNEGKEVAKYSVAPGTSSHILNRENLKIGLYYYEINIPGRETLTGRLLLQ